MIDLHTHSNFSDGSDSPTELARLAHEAGLGAIALTDHDTTASAPEMARACAELGVEHVVGVEISLADPRFPRRGVDGAQSTRHVHVLAYFVPLEPDSPVQRALAALRQDRDDRNRRLLGLLHELGFTRLSFGDLVGRAHSADAIGRPHFAQAMFDLHPEIVGENSPDNWRRLFDEWLGDRGRAYLPKTSMTIEDFVELARGTGTVFSVAHPHLNYLEHATTESVATGLAPVIASLRERGFAGVESYYGGTSPEIRALVVKLTRDAGLIPTGGSDYHGFYKEDVGLGVGRGDLRVPDSILNELRAAR
ncbi:MAG: PHP domain-containing protein [Acidobacteriota bacterium]|nr:PHP domain-containing protein [Acidobacteriota bacterium]